MAKVKALEEREYPNIPIVPPSHAPAPKVALPEKFDGSSSQFRDFLAAVHNYLQIQGWFRTLVERNDQVL
jgi:hypothetical protein